MPLTSQSPSTNKSRVNPEFIVGLILFLFGLLTIRESRKLLVGSLHAPGPGFFPFWLGGMVATFSFILLLGLFMRKIEVIRGQWKGLLWQKVVFTSAILFVYTFTLELTGYPAGTFILLVILFRLIEKRNIFFVLGLSGFISVGTYFLFKYWLYIQLPMGIISL